jgi:hypothetical protein
MVDVQPGLRRKPYGQWGIAMVLATFPLVLGYGFGGDWAIGRTMTPENSPTHTVKDGTAPSIPRLAQTSRVRRIQFAPGKFSTTLKDAVVRGTRDIFLVGASQGQTMIVRIKSIEDNAVFEITAPPNKAGQRRSLKPEAVAWSGVLPATGDYQIIVGSTRGNATYQLQVTIK